MEVAVAGPDSLRDKLQDCSTDQDDYTVRKMAEIALGTGCSHELGSDLRFVTLNLLFNTLAELCAYLAVCAKAHGGTNARPMPV